MHWTQLLPFQSGDALIIILIREGVTQGDPLMMVLYVIALVPLTEELRDVDPTISPLFYANDAAFGGPARRIVAQLQLLVYWGADWVYFPEPAKSLLIADILEDEEEVRWEFMQAGLNLNYVGVII